MGRLNAKIGIFWKGLKLVKEKKIGNKNFIFISWYIITSHTRLLVNHPLNYFSEENSETIPSIIDIENQDKDLEIRSRDTKKKKTL